MANEQTNGDQSNNEAPNDEQLTGGAVQRYDTREAVQAQLAKERDLSNADMRCVDLSGIKLGGIAMRNCDLHGSDLSGAKLGGCDMQGSNLAGACLDHAHVAGVDLSKANLQEASLRHTKLMGVDLKNADLSGADIGGSMLVGVDVEGADFSNVKTTGAKGVVDWTEAAVAPEVLPEPLRPKIPNWLPLLVVATIFVGAVVLLRKRRGRQSDLEATDAGR
jgi:uncharacterized protein YjbI with pentapeptide repeats